MPFTHVSRLITGFVEIIGQRFYILRQCQRISMAVYLCRIFTALQAGTRGTANRLAGKGIFKFHALLCQSVEIGGNQKRLSITP